MKLTTLEKKIRLNAIAIILLGVANIINVVVIMLNQNALNKLKDEVHKNSVEIVEKMKRD